ncbi:hypothetical protein ABNB80_12235 [Paenibacillus larvae]
MFVGFVPLLRGKRHPNPVFVGFSNTDKRSHHIGAVLGPLDPAHIPAVVKTGARHSPALGQIDVPIANRTIRKLDAKSKLARKLTANILDGGECRRVILPVKRRDSLPVDLAR